MIFFPLIIRNLSRCVHAAYVICIFWLIMGAPAMAHPLDDLTIRRINQYFIIDGRGAQPVVFYLLRMAEIPSFEEMNRIDPNYNREVSEEELTSYLDQRTTSLMENLHLSVNGEPVSLNVQKRRLKLDKGRGGMNVINLYLTLIPEGFVWPDQGQSFELVLRSDNFTDAFGERECKFYHNGRFGDQPDERGTGRGSLQQLLYVDVEGNPVFQNAESEFVFNLKAVNDHVVVESLEPTFAWIEKTVFLPTGLSNSAAKSQQDIAFDTQEQAGKGSMIDSPEAEKYVPVESLLSEGSEGLFGTMYERVTGTIRAKKLTARMFFSGLLIALFLGMGHALSPGHGKTVMAAYLIGERGTVWNAIVLGVAVTITHTWSVLAIGAVTLYTQEFISSEYLNFWLSMVSGGIIVLIGLLLFFRRYANFILERYARAFTANDHDHNLHHPHDHGHDHSHVIKTDDGSHPSIWSILGLGISGGIVPCASALIVLLLAINFNRPVYGLWLISSFSLGLAIVLIFLGVLVVRAKGLVQKKIGGGCTLAILPVISSGLIVMMGLVLLVGTLVQYRILVLRL